MKKNEPVSSIMSKELITVHEKNKFSEIRKIFFESDFRHLPVVSGNKPIGIISKNDVLRFCFGQAFGQDEREVDATLDATISIEQLMSHEITTISPSDSIRDATAILGEGKFNALPVVENEALVGIVTTTDLLRYFESQY